MARTRLQLYFLAIGMVWLAISGSLGYRIMQGDIPFTDSTNHGYLTYAFWIPTIGKSSHVVVTFKIPIRDFNMTIR